MGYFASYALQGSVDLLNTYQLFQMALYRVAQVYSQPNSIKGLSSSLRLQFTKAFARYGLTSSTIFNIGVAVLALIQPISYTLCLAQYLLIILFIASKSLNSYDIIKSLLSFEFIFSI